MGKTLILCVFAVLFTPISGLIGVKTIHRTQRHVKIINPFENAVMGYKHVHSTSLSSTTLPNSSEPSVSIRKSLYLCLWIGLVGYTFGFSPGGSAESALVDNAIIQNMISTPFDGKFSPVFAAIFNYLGILPAIYASLLLPGSKDQKIPALPFIVSSFALGFFGIGPYLALRNDATEVTAATRGMGSGAFEFKGASLALLAFGLYLTYYAFTGSFEGDRFQSFLELFKSQRLAHVSTIDFTILSLAVSNK
eukprot:gene6716-13609_t